MTQHQDAYAQAEACTFPMPTTLVGADLVR